jgi:hypothetical protein
MDIKKSDSMKPWFRRRRGLFSPDLGWGYMPISFEGILVVISMIVIIFISSLYLIIVQKENPQVFWFLIIILGTIILTALIADYTCSEPYIFRRNKK